MEKPWGFDYAVLQHYEPVALFQDEDHARMFAKALHKDTHDTVEVASWSDFLDKYKAFERIESEEEK